MTRSHSNPATGKASVTGSKSSSPVRTTGVESVKRKRGRPKKSERAVTPEVLEDISHMWCQGFTLSAIATKYNVDRKTIEHHLNQTIRPTWETKLHSSAAVELAKIDTLERVAWERFRESSTVQTKKKLKEQLLRPTEDGKVASLGIVEKVVHRQRMIGDATWMNIVQWCVEQRCKLLGHYGAAKVEMTGDLTMRVAGLSPTEINEQMLARLATKIAERRRYEAALAAAAGSQN